VELTSTFFSLDVWSIKSPLSEWGGRVGEIVWFGFGAGKDNITGHIILEPPPPRVRSV